MISNKYNIGIEREGLRCDENGDLSSRPHSKFFGNRNNNQFITTDFGAAQLEIRTPVCKSTKECYEKLENITDVVLEVLRKDKELLWPYSMPCRLPKEEEFKFGEYKENKSEAKYEKYLYQKYGLEMFCMSGIHLNFSLNQDYYQELRKKNNTLPEKLDDAYFKIIRNYLKRVWMLIYLFGATPRQSEEIPYQNECSIRNSYQQGFKNLKLDPLNFENKEKHIASIRQNIKNGNIAKISELYTPIRIKTSDKYDIEKLASEEINHIEVRILDLDPFDKCSVSLKEMDFITSFLFYCLLTDEKCDYTYDYRVVAEKGITEEQKQMIVDEIDKILAINQKYHLEFKDSLLQVKNDLLNNRLLAERVKKLVLEQGYIKGLLLLARKYDNEANNDKYFVKYHGKRIEDANAALIKDALARGIDFEVIELRENDSIIKFINGKREAYIVGATQTNKDNYIVHYLSEDKYISKRIMSQNKISVPNGIMINKDISEEELNRVIDKYSKQAVVIKPRTTNGGIGITVFPTIPSKAHLKKAVVYAFKYDKDILIEDYIKGTEYRFLVINNQLVSVVNRRNAQVIGDGKRTILELIKEKNKEDWHHLLDTEIKIDQPLKMFIKKHHLTLNDIPKKDEIIVLRKNSNCSTGGESINETDVIPERFKKVAEHCAKVFGIHVCGIDMIIDDLKEKDYHILEINADPGYDINEWPYEGEQTQVGLKILEMLGLTEKENDWHE